MTVQDQIRQWLEGLGLGQYRDTFEANDIDSRALARLSDEDLKEMGVSLGHRRIMLAEIETLGQDQPPRARDARAVEGAGEGERRQITILFFDLVGSTALSHQLDPEDLRELLQRYQNVTSDFIVRFGGYVARFQGDGVVAYFGWPQAIEDQAVQAVHAAMGAVEAVGAIRIDGNENLHARAGIATGQVVISDLVGDIASDTEAVTGETPNLAARLEAIATPGTVLISSSTRRLLGRTFELEALEPLQLKGFPEDVLAWCVIGETAVESRFEAARGKALTRLVGREHELGLLRERWELAKEGEGQVILLSGEAGIGKSRMVQDFTDDIGSTQPRFNLRYQCSPHHTNSAFYPVIQRLERAARFYNTDSPEEKFDKLEALLTEMKENVEVVAPLFATLLSLPVEQRYGSQDLMPQQLRQRTIQALIDQALALSRQRPLLFVVEDAHWVDPSSMSFLGEIMPMITDRRVLILVTYRPEQAPTWPVHPHVTSIALNRLGRRQAAQIAYAVGGQGIMDAVIDRIVARADGVPLYIEELTKSVQESYITKDEDTAGGLIPATLQSSLEARLDRLGGAKEIAQIGAIIGREFTYDLLAMVVDKSEDEINNALDRLVESGLVFRRGVAPNVTYTFKHALVQDAAYATVLISRRRRLHAVLVEALEIRWCDQIGDKIDVLALHAYQGEVWDKAFTYLQQAGVKAMDRAAVREAVALFEQALVAGSQLPDTRESLQQDIDLRFELRNALWSIGAFEEILENLKDAERLAQKLEDSTRTGWILVFTSASLWQLGRPTEALAAAEKALSQNQDEQDLSLGIGATFYLGCAHITAGNYQRAESLFGDIADSLKGDLSRERCGLPFVPAVISRSWLLWSLAERGEFEQAMEHGQVALRIAEDVGHPFNLAHIYYDLGYYYGVKGEFDEAVAALEYAYNVIKEWSLSYLSPFITGFYGHASALAGRAEEGVSLLQQATAEYEAIGLGLFRSMVGVQLGEALFLAGRAEEAFECTERALALARKRVECGHEAWALRLLGEISSQADAADDNAARKYYGEALTLATTLGMRPLAAHCYHGLGRVLQRTGQQKEAEERMTKATEMYADIGMDRSVFDALLTPDLVVT